MTIHISPTRRSERRQHTDRQSPGPVAASPRGPVARLVALSLAAGLVAAAVLTLVVFPGGTESTLTGSVLTAFGLGWALMRFLTTRFTDRPLRWTAVPAVAMTATGVALMVTTPQAHAMSAMSWIWPAPTVALAAYVWMRARRTLPRRGRVLITPVAVVLAVAAVAATYEDISVARDQHTYAAGPGRTYDVGGHRLYLDCRGHGGPTVVLSNGLGEVAASWARIIDQVDTTTRVCAYDRAGQGWSSDAAPQDGVTAARDLHTLLRVAGEHGPYVLVGHSTGGTYAMTYAAQYPQQIAGMVLLDSSSPRQFDLPAYPTQYAAMRRGLALLPTLDRFGLGRLMASSDLPQPAADVVAALTGSAHGARNGRDEISMAPQVFADAQALTTLGSRPLAVLSASESVDGTSGWAAAQARMAALSTDRIHRVVDATHAGMVEDQAPAHQSALAVDQVVHAVRTGTRLAAR